MSTAETNYIEVKNRVTKDIIVSCPICNYVNLHQYISNNRRSFGSIHNSIRYQCNKCGQKYIINFCEDNSGVISYSIVKLC